MAPYSAGARSAPFLSKIRLNINLLLTEDSEYFYILTKEYLYVKSGAVTVQIGLPIPLTGG